MPRALFKIWIKDNEKTSFCAFASNKSQSFLELKPHCSVTYSTIVLCLFSKQTGKVENFSTKQLSKNDAFLMSFFSLCNDAFQSNVLKASDLHPVSSPTRQTK